MSKIISQRLTELGLRLPEPPIPRGEYVSVVVHGGIAYVSGQVSRADLAVITGPASSETPSSTAAAAAHVCVLRALSALEQERGGLDAVERILFLRGYIHARPEFLDHSRILDPASRLLHEIFGERGHHARSAVGVASLPDGGLLEIELMAATRLDSNYKVVSIT